MRKSKRVLAMGLTVGVFATGCGGEGSKTPEVGYSQQTEHHDRQVEPAKKITKPEMHRDLGKRVLDGCNIRQARDFLRKRVIDGRRFLADRMVDNEGNTIPAYIGNAAITMANPLVLKCGGKIKAYAGIFDGMKTISNHSHDPVKVISASDKEAQLYVESDTLKIGSKPISIHFDRSLFEGYGGHGDVATAFVDDMGDVYGSALNMPFDGLAQPDQEPPQQSLGAA